MKKLYLTLILLFGLLAFAPQIARADRVTGYFNFNNKPNRTHNVDMGKPLPEAAGQAKIPEENIKIKSEQKKIKQHEKIRNTILCILFAFGVAAVITNLKKKVKL